jgi:hypothetical protein
MCRVKARNSELDFVLVNKEDMKTATVVIAGGVGTLLGLGEV